MRTLAEIKRDMIAARNSDNEEWAKQLSQEKQRVKKKLRARCIECGTAVSRGSSGRCCLCYLKSRYYEKTIPITFT